MVKIINNIKEGSVSVTSEDRKELKDTMKAFMFDILGLSEMNSEAETDGEKLSGTIELLIQLRAEARANKNFALSDQIRDQLLEMGIQLKDGKEGTTFSLN